MFNLITKITKTFIKSKHESNDNEINTKSNLHKSIRVAITLAQCFALMPVDGVRNSHVNDLKFKWCSLKTFFSATNICASFALALMNLLWFINNGKHFQDIIAIFFYSSTILITLLFINLARKWPELSRKWWYMEIAMSKYEYQPNLARKLKIITATVMFLALGEHLLFNAQLISLLVNCPNYKTDPMKTYFAAAFSQIFGVTSYSIWKSFLIEFYNVSATFAWNFMDLFIILMCASLTERFRQINHRILKTEVRNEFFWKEIREDYNRLTVLCATLDNAISNFISLSFGNNLFFIGVQLYNSLKPITGVIHTVYFFCSFGFLISRTLAVCLYAASINEESLKLLHPLFDIPSEDYGNEAKRLIQQISCCPAAITGSKCFAVTRHLCLQVAGTIITFELILQQIGPKYLNSDDDSGEPVFCLN